MSEKTQTERGYQQTVFSRCRKLSADTLLSRLTFYFCFFSFLLLVLPACGDTFQPLKENDAAPFSIYGYLDASVDTQWVRVTPVREQLHQSPVKPEMAVTIQHLQNGSSAVMRDSLLQLRGGFNIVNAWTTTNVEPGQTYRLRAERPDGAASQVTVTIPDDFPTPRLNGRGCSTVLVIRGVKNLADVQYRWHVRISTPEHEYETFWSVPYRNRVRTIASDEYWLHINFDGARGQAAASFGTLPANTTVRILDRHIFVAAGGPEWIDHEELASISDIEYGLPEAMSNVENGTGYMIGVVSKIIPDEQECD